MIKVRWLDSDFQRLVWVACGGGEIRLMRHRVTIVSCTRLLNNRWTPQALVTGTVVESSHTHTAVADQTIESPPSYYCRLYSIRSSIIAYKTSVFCTRCAQTHTHTLKTYPLEEHTSLTLLHHRVPAGSSEGSDSNNTQRLAVHNCKLIITLLLLFVHVCTAIDTNFSVCIFNGIFLKNIKNIVYTFWFLN